MSTKIPMAGVSPVSGINSQEPDSVMLPSGQSKSAMIDEAAAEAAAHHGVKGTTRAAVAQALAGASPAQQKLVATDFMVNIAKKINQQYYTPYEVNVTPMRNLFLGYRDVNITSGNAVEYLFNGLMGATLPNDPNYESIVPTTIGPKNKMWANTIVFDEAKIFKVEIMTRKIEPFEYFVNNQLLNNYVSAAISRMAQVAPDTLYFRFALALKQLVTIAGTPDGMLKITTTNSTNFADAIINLSKTFKQFTKSSYTDKLNLKQSTLNKFVTGVNYDNFVAIVHPETETNFQANKAGIFQLAHSVGGKEINFPEMISADTSFYTPRDTAPNYTTGNPAIIALDIVGKNQVLFVHKTIFYKWGYVYNATVQQFFAKVDQDYTVQHVWPFDGFLENGQCFLVQDDKLLNLGP